MSAATETPVCPTHHRPMTAREPGTPEQAWCGQWFRCDEPGTPRCLTTALIPSAGLIRQEETL